MTYTWSGFRIVCLGEKSAAQSVEEPDFQNAAARYNETDIFPCFVMRLARNAFQKGRNVEGGDNRLCRLDSGVISVVNIFPRQILKAK